MKLSIVSLAFLLILIEARYVCAVTYEVTRLPVAGSSAYAINEQAQIAGVSNQLAPFVIHAFVAQRDLSIVDLGVFGGGESYAYDINDLGEVVGRSSVRAGDSSPHAFRGLHNRALSSATDDLGTFGGDDSVALGINNLGQVVGSAELANGVSHAFRTQPNAPINPLTDDLGTLGGPSSNAAAINDLGQIVGESQFPDGTTHAFRTAPNLPVNPATDDLGVPPGYSDCSATDINERGEVVGYCRWENTSRAFRTGPNQAIDPTNFFAGQGRSIALGINDHGWVVGYTTVGTTQRAFVFDGTRMIDLKNNTDSTGAGWLLLEARDINNAGQIVGSGWYNDNQAFLLTPVIPEPHSAALAALGSVVIILRMRRRWRSF